MAIDLDGLVLGPCMEVFGEAAKHEPVGAASYDITGVFDEAYRELTPLGPGPFPATERVNLGAIGGITSVMPVLGIRLSAMQVRPQQGDGIVIRRTGIRYVVKEVQPDGHGWAKLTLIKAADATPALPPPFRP